jgi:hypothetical protein
MAALFLAANDAASQHAAIDLCIDVVVASPKLCLAVSDCLLACVASSQHRDLATDSVRIKLAALCLHVMPAPTETLSRATDLVITVLSTAVKCHAAAAKSAILSEIAATLVRTPDLKMNFACIAAAQLLCNIVESSNYNDCAAVAAFKTLTCIVCDCPIAQQAFDSREVFAALSCTASRSTSAATHAEVCRVMTALIRGRGSACHVWCDVEALNNCIRATCSRVQPCSCEAAAELLDCLAAEMDERVAQLLHARGDLTVAVDCIATSASSHWCRVALLSAVYRLIRLAPDFRSSLRCCSLVATAHAAMSSAEDDFECGVIANAIGELVRGHAANKAAFSCEGTCVGLKAMAEAAVEQATVQVVGFSRAFFSLRLHLSLQDIAFAVSSLYCCSSTTPMHRSAATSAALLCLYVPSPCNAPLPHRFNSLLKLSDRCCRAGCAAALRTPQ